MAEDVTGYKVASFNVGTSGTCQTSGTSILKNVGKVSSFSISHQSVVKRTRHRAFTIIERLKVCLHSHVKYVRYKCQLLEVSYKGSVLKRVHSNLLVRMIKGLNTECSKD